ncbi:MAG: hypothetical protein HC802_03880 [Caldilineaceae bacterium]|nr:hypothetical protein [Caldilineaceae bacterium]
MATAKDNIEKDNIEDVANTDAPAAETANVVTADANAPEATTEEGATSDSADAGVPPADDASNRILPPQPDEALPSTDEPTLSKAEHPAQNGVAPAAEKNTEDGRTNEPPEQISPVNRPATAEMGSNGPEKESPDLARTNDPSEPEGVASEQKAFNLNGTSVQSEGEP